MNISDLSYQETAIETNNLEGGISVYEIGSSFLQHIQSLGAVSWSSPSGTYVNSSVLELFTDTSGGLKVVF